MASSAAARTESSPPQGSAPRRDSAPVLLQLAGRQAEATPGAGIPGRVGMKGCKLRAPRPSSPPPRPLPAASGLACLAERGGREAGRARSCRVRDARRLAGPCSVLPKWHKTAVVRSGKFPRLGSPLLSEPLETTTPTSSSSARSAPAPGRCLPNLSG
uniref:artemin-like n=1 Tax=Macaca mulatta TaxID=9544 RepID=UPI0010A23847|nr:artemin-like [Macaca mulatta]